MYEKMDLLELQLESNKLERIYNKYKFLGDCGRDFRRLVSDIFSNYTSPKDSLNRFKCLHDLVDSNHNLIGYITFNYDYFLEDSLKKGYTYIDINTMPNHKHTLSHDGLPLIKLHGSLNWEQNSDGDMHFHNQCNGIIPKYKSDSDWSQPAIIPPTLFKQEINDDSKSNDFFTKIFLQQWKAAIHLLRYADTLIFVGYSFPPTDFHSKRLFHLSSMHAKLVKKSVYKILNCDGPVSGNKVSYENDKSVFFKTIFGSACTPKYGYGFKSSLEEGIFEEFLKK